MFLVIFGCYGILNTVFESYQDVTSCIEGLSAGILTFFLFALKKTVFH